MQQVYCPEGDLLSGTEQIEVEEGWLSRYCYKLLARQPGVWSTAGERVFCTIVQCPDGSRGPPNLSYSVDTGGSFLWW
jgi:hypothetical protein